MSVREAWAALRGHMLVNEGGDGTMRGVWFKGGDSVALVNAVDAALREQAGVEEVAKAIWDSEEAGLVEQGRRMGNGYSAESWADATNGEREEYMGHARAALRALGLDPEGGSDA